jgi:hypothetical protein
MGTGGEYTNRKVWRPESAVGQFDGWGGSGLCLEVWRIDEVAEMSDEIWRRAAASVGIWRSTVDFRPPRAIFPQNRPVSRALLAMT